MHSVFNTWITDKLYCYSTVGIFFNKINNNNLFKINKTVRSPIVNS